jgi:hypothetical protein
MKTAKKPSRASRRAAPPCSTMGTCLLCGYAGKFNPSGRRLKWQCPQCDAVQTPCAYTSNDQAQLRTK